MNEDVAVVTFAWNGSRPIYTPWQAENMRRMVAKHLSIPHRFIVVTDDEAAHRAVGLETLPIWDAPRFEMRRTNWLNCYVRLGLFDRDIGGAIAPRILSLDLDAVIRAPIDDFFDGDAPFKILSLKSRTWLQGGLFRVDPGKVHPCPWDQIQRNAETDIFERADKWIGSEQAVLSELFYNQVKAGLVPSWTEDDGISVNEFNAPWRVFFRTGHTKCWHISRPEREAYLSESGRDSVPSDLPATQAAVLPSSPPRRKTIQRLKPRLRPRVRAPEYKVILPGNVTPLGGLRQRAQAGGQDGNQKDHQD